MAARVNSPRQVLSHSQFGLRAPRLALCCGTETAPCPVGNRTSGFLGTKINRSLSIGRQSGKLSRRAGKDLAVKAEISYIMVKPDGVQRGLVGEVISRLERKGFKLVGLKMLQCPKELAEEHYKDLSSKPFFSDLVNYIISGPVVAMVWEGNGVVKSARKIIGATNPLEAEPGTIRGDFAVEVGRNVVHGSDSPENGEREAALWFGGESFVEWTPSLTPWLVE
uniref:Nucleoside diphosphate kinase n=1 Tax=Tetraselmis sp. GSL018 TaxID=582737 RepID=A0A061S192_9CHLO